ncbi:hypothetical protein AMTRI_Chr04g252670 [Amborella trichopoda]
MREGLVVVHYYDLRHVQHAVAEIQAQHVAHQARIAMWHRATAAGQGFGHGGGEPGAAGSLQFGGGGHHGEAQRDFQGFW